MKTLSHFIVLAFLLITSQLVGQNPYCDGTRYLDEIFPTVTTTTVKYGENVTFGGALKNLRMDIYLPDGDVATERPVVIMAFGGSFIWGDKATMAYYCDYFAKRGYVAASIDYRLYDGPFFPFPDSIVMLDVVIKAVGDMKAAVRYFRKDAATTNQYKIDTNNIFIGGQSAGGILAAHTAYINDLSEVKDSFIYHGIIANGGLEGTTDDPANSAIGYSSEIHGVINQFGGLYDPDYIKQGDVPFISIHGTNDDVVPYGTGMVSIQGIPIVKMNGSGVLHPRANQEGVFNHLITVPGGGHGDYLSDPLWSDSLDHVSVWLMESIACGTLSSVEQLDVSNQISVYPNPANEFVNIELADIQSTFDVKVFDQLGRLVLTADGITQEDHRLDVSSLQKGIYQFYVVFDDQKLAPYSKNVFITNQK